jgi:hypothetical protein
LTTPERLGDWPGDSREELCLGVGEAGSGFDAPQLEERPATESVSEDNRRRIVDAVVGEQFPPDQAAFRLV